MAPARYAHENPFSRHPILSLPPLEEPDGTVTITHLESAALLLWTHVVVDDPSEDKPGHAKVRSLVRTSYWTRERGRELTSDEIAAVLRNMPGSLVPGPDGLTPALVRGLAEVQPGFVGAVCNSALPLGCWRRGRVIFILKPNKPPQLRVIQADMDELGVAESVRALALRQALFLFEELRPPYMPSNMGLRTGEARY
ncbi:hypothetical protein HPB49_022127 [Dermacentor silvarum]|uniref:Uncharacterized protein n=1 Tax=Dermacentor silvarum TaxID=543639 RepID=A0ACB8DQW0_DERSI|nr:hypothetical protein HPB49_022127 [Dermacentor silvarum]